jgi:hypothetical protein
MPGDRLNSGGFLRMMPSLFQSEGFILFNGGGVNRFGWPLGRIVSMAIVNSVTNSTATACYALNPRKSRVGTGFLAALTVEFYSLVSDK